MSRRTLAALAAVGVLGAALWWWRSSGSADEREVRRLFADFAAEFNAGTTGGLATVARTARLSEFFSPDVVVELGQGSPPIKGRDALMGMMFRLQPRTAAFVIELDDVNVQFTAPDRGEVTFTAVIRRRSFESSAESIDAREFAGEVVRIDRRWRVSRVVAIDTLR
jgi:hypothetical protein